MTPEEIIHSAYRAEGLSGKVIKVGCEVVGAYALCSGGTDSTVMAHRCRDYYNELVFIDTGTALPGVVNFIHEFAAWLRKPLRVYEAGDAYRTMILGSDAWWKWYEHHAKPQGMDVPAAIRYQAKHRIRGIGNSPQGFPGPAGGHRVAYSRLKERQIQSLMTDAKKNHTRMARVALFTGARRSESARRMRTQGADGYRLEKSKLWINPLNFWTGEDVREYHRENEIPRSDVSALMHRSGECNCGAYAKRGEREELQALFPDWWETTIAPLEMEAKLRGIPRCFWAERLDSGRIGARGVNDPGILCSDCELR